MLIRRAKASDFKELYSLGKKFPELTVSEKAFMTKEEFMAAIKNKNGIFLVVEDKGRIAGFSYAAIEGKTYASMVYNLVTPAYRGLGIGRKLVRERERWLRKKGIRTAYLLGTNRNIISMMRHMGYKEGKKLVWMEKPL
ncbi:MAG: GNAT family N-acetyltransferase [Candidatus Micrarchaeota archaeon]|nr:GNAT family N-acetyltransferase [Candidatus Micrarchaeota archaeon]